MQAVLTHEGMIRIAIFATVLIAMMLLEAWLPRRRRSLERRQRWPANLGIVVAGSVLARLILPLPPVAVALWAEQSGTGLLNVIDMPSPISIVASFIFLDLAIYTQHVVFHKIPMLWRLHRMHHADTDFDVTTGIRFHPFEIILSLLIKIALITALGIPAIAVIVFEIALNAFSMFNHANLRLPAFADRTLRRLIVTPDMHRVHHSWHGDELNSNFGFNLSIWDRLFKTYRAQPKDGHDDMNIGLSSFREAKNRSLTGLLMIPFRN
ncbi:MAG: sterol desaturase family protein [Rhodospirillales bacterium]